MDPLPVFETQLLHFAAWTVCNLIADSNIVAISSRAQQVQVHGVFGMQHIE